MINNKSNYTKKEVQTKLNQLLEFIKADDGEA